MAGATSAATTAQTTAKLTDSLLPTNTEARELSCGLEHGHEGCTRRLRGVLQRNALYSLAAGAGSVVNRKLGGRRSSSAIGHQIPPWRARYASSTGTRQGCDWSRTTPAVRNQPSRLAGAPGIASQATAVLYLARRICLRCHDTVCLSTACSARCRGWLRIADMRPVIAAPV
ncbi:hypothetical protein LA080_000703 [Diaporthe eres]|nr:hypothetical protein LA080_000703 [Diaporthe eres]